MGRFVYLEGVTRADAALEVLGDDLGDLFETAARALAETMVDPGTLADDCERAVELAAPELDLLLFDWLSEIIYRKDADREVFPRAEVRIEGSGPYRLVAVLHGGPLDPETTEVRADLKAVTLHRFTLEAAGHGWRAQFVVDV